LGEALRGRVIDGEEKAKIGLHMRKREWEELLLGKGSPWEHSKREEIRRTLGGRGNLAVSKPKKHNRKGTRKNRENSISIFTRLKL